MSTSHCSPFYQAAQALPPPLPAGHELAADTKQVPSQPLAPAAACHRDHLPSLLSPAQEPRAGRGLPISPRQQKVQEGVLGAQLQAEGSRGCSAEPTRAHQAQPQRPGTTLPLFTGHGSRPGIPGPVSTARLAACTKRWAESGALYTGSASIRQRQE